MRPTRGVLSSAVPGAKGKPARGNKPSAFDHPTWAVKKLASAETPEQVRESCKTYLDLIDARYVLVWIQICSTKYARMLGAVSWVKKKQNGGIKFLHLVFFGSTINIETQVKKQVKKNDQPLPCSELRM